MRHCRIVAGKPRCAADVPTSVYLDILIALLTAIKPLLEAKEAAEENEW